MWPFIAALLALSVVGLYEHRTHIQCASPEITAQSGLFAAPFGVEVRCDDPALRLIYTTDGTVPSYFHGSEYSGPITIETTTVLRVVSCGLLGKSSPPATATYIFPRDVSMQKAQQSGYSEYWKIDRTDRTVLDAYKKKANYGMNPNAVKDPENYAQSVEQALRALPTVSIVSDKDRFFGYRRGMYSNCAKRGPSWERRATVEYLDSDGAPQFQQDCGIRIQGKRASDPGLTDKYAFRLGFDERHGKAMLDYPVFGRNAATSFSSLVLRSMTDDNWTYLQNREFYGNYKVNTNALFLRDRFARELQAALGYPVVHGQFVHVYINGLYWGIYTLSESPDSEFMAFYLGGKKGAYDIQIGMDVEEGKDETWETVRRLANEDMTDNGNCNAVFEYVDQDNLIDYVLVNQFVANIDWQAHNCLFAKRQEQGSKYRFFVWDAELCMSNPKYDDLDGLVAARRTKGGRDFSRVFFSAYMLFLRGIENTEFRLHFADHVQRHFFGNGALTTENAAKRWRSLAGELDKAIVAESARWGDCGNERTFTREDDWLPLVAWVEEEFLPKRREFLLESYRSLDIIPEIEAPEFAANGGDLENEGALKMAASCGEIYYTLDGSDPRLPGGNVNQESAIQYREPVFHAGTGVIRARAFDGANWSAIVEADLRVQ